MENQDHETRENEYICRRNHCGCPQKLDNLNRCKMACKLRPKGPFYEKEL